VIASAQFDRPAITDQVTLEIETDGGEVFRQQPAMTPPGESADRVSTVARLAASIPERAAAGDRTDRSPSAVMRRESDLTRAAGSLPRATARTTAW